MSVNQVYIVDELKQKMQLLSEKLEQHRRYAEQLALSNTELEARIKKQEIEINELKQKNNTLKLSQAFVAENNGESQEAKLQINKIVREIDKCIALLNR